ncbi:MAG: MFS transporter [Acidimicrobiales bacterium]|jgi:MFS family permease
MTDVAVAPPEVDNYRWHLLAVIALAVAGFGSLMTLVTAALDTIADDFNTTAATASWVLTALMLAMAVGTPMGGKLSDIFGHRRMFLIGVGAMTAMMFMCAIAPSIGLLIAFRVMFGMAGALLMPSGMALIMAAFGPDGRAKALGWFQFAMTGAPTIGVVIGGPLMDLMGWRGVFFVFGCVSTLAFIAAIFVVRPIKAGGRATIDFLGALLLSGSTLLVLFSITRAAELSRTGSPILSDATMWFEVVGALVGYTLFVGYELSCKEPLLDVRLFRKATFSMPLLASSANQFAYMGAFVVVPRVLQGPYGYSVGISALLMMPRPGVFAIASPVGGSLVGLVGWRIPMYIGTVSMVGSMGAFALGSTEGGLVFIMIGLILSGLSAGIASPAYQALVASSVADKDLGIANGMSQTVMWMGIIMGIQSMLAFSGETLTVSRTRWTFVFGGVVALIGLVAPLTAPRHRHRSAAVFSVEPQRGAEDRLTRSSQGTR